MKKDLVLIIIVIAAGSFLISSVFGWPVGLGTLLIATAVAST